ncbi:hypothetical protein JB92DRAFT_2829943 [Gautieria morchelliformis]|nr:hypothetical protein JB92DRAFT_2829943 [Gautieria morchelliformis]
MNGPFLHIHRKATEKATTTTLEKTYTDPDRSQETPHSVRLSASGDLAAASSACALLQANTNGFQYSRAIEPAPSKKARLASKLRSSGTVHCKLKTLCPPRRALPLLSSFMDNVTTSENIGMRFRSQGWLSHWGKHLPIPRWNLLKLGGDPYRPVSLSGKTGRPCHDRHPAAAGTKWEASSMVLFQSFVATEG